LIVKTACWKTADGKTARQKTFDCEDINSMLKTAVRQTADLETAGRRRANRMTANRKTSCQKQLINRGRTQKRTSVNLSVYAVLTKLFVIFSNLAVRQLSQRNCDLFALTRGSQRDVVYLG
jgi:hypothetical protein